MNRCLDCNGLLTKDETVCVQCGAKVRNSVQKLDTRKIATRVVQFVFLGSLGTTIIGLFMENGPSFITGILISFAMALIRRSLKEQPGESFSRR